MSVIDEVKERLDIVEVVSSYVTLKKAGRTHKGLCPFHTEKTPSFVVFPDTQSWHCFGACGTGGDIFAFVMRQENVDFSEALEILARRAGVELKPQTEAQKAEGDLQQRLIEVNRLAAAYFHNLLLLSPNGEVARNYLAGRGINRETIDRFQLGYALDNWHALGPYLAGKGYKETDLVSSGLAVAREDGGHYDRFRNRIMIPICDQMGRPIGFGGRVLDDSQPKYLNTSETPIFEKGHVLFGIDLAKAAIRAEDMAIVVEGYMDVLQAHQHGVTHVVASMGTALTEHQVKVLRKYARTIILALDPDAAGSQATLRGLDLSRRITLHEVVKIGPALVESQYSSEADVRIAVLPQGKDPDDVIRETPELWAEIIRKALPVVDYYLQLMQGQFDLTTAQGKAMAVDQLLPVIRDIENPIQQAHYLQKLARLIQVDEKLLHEQLKGHKRRKVGQEEAWQTVKGIRARRPSFEVEEHCLVVLLQQPEVLSQANRVLAEIGQPPLGAADFSSVENRQLFLALGQSDAQPTEVTIDMVRQRLDDSIEEHLDRLLAYAATLPAVPEDLVNSDSIKTVLKLRKQIAQKRFNELNTLRRDAESEGDSITLQEYSQLMQTQVLVINLLEQAMDARTMTSQRRLTKRYGVVNEGSPPDTA